MFDVYEECVGQIGRWQILQIFLLSLLRLSTSWHQMGIVFLAPAPDFHCSVEHIDKCDDACPSHEFVYDENWETIVIKWDLVCGRQYLVSLTQSVSMLGMLFGSVIIGFISDVYGRKIPLIGTIVLTLVSGVAAAFTPWLWLFMTMKFFNAAAIGGINVNAFVLAMELIGKTYRTSAGSFFHMPFFIGLSLLGLLGYLLRNWQHFQFIVSIVSVVFLCYYWIIPESPRWLLVSGRTDEAVKIIQKAARFNGLPHEDIKAKVDDYLQTKMDNVNKTSYFIDLVRTKNMRLRSISLFVIYFCIFFVYYGVTQYIGEVGDTYINIGISGFIEIPGTFVCIYLMNKIGRKRTLILGNVLSAVVCFLFMVVPENVNWGYTVLGALGILFNGFSVTSNYIYSGELFPTVVRSLGMGLSATFSKIGSTIAPFLIGEKFNYPWLPPVVLGLLPLFACVFCVKLPETLNTKLPDTIEEIEGKGDQN